MKLTFAKAAAALTLIAASTFALPLAANADGYPAADAAQVSPAVVAPGGVVTFSVDPGTFAPGEPVVVSITGESANSASLAFAKAAVETNQLGTFAANASGGLDPIAIRLPANASGRYSITATSATQPAGVSAVVTIAAAPGAGGPGSGLPATGMDSGSLLGLWVGGGALVLAGGAVAVGAAVYRQRKQAA